MNHSDTVELCTRIQKYRWYHNIEVAEGIFTLPGHTFQPIWDFIIEAFEAVDFNRKAVLDLGCRDGLFSFEAEKRGARTITGIDNDMSPGATELLIPLFNSKVKLEEKNIYDINPEDTGRFDIILFLGLLYHLRYPVWGLKKAVDCLEDKGLLIIEAGMMECGELEDFEFVYCPVEKEPYEPTSCSFFNKKALVTTLLSLGCRILTHKILPNPDLKVPVVLPNGMKILISRQLAVFQKDHDIKFCENYEMVRRYWNSTHTLHTLG